MHNQHTLDGGYLVLAKRPRLATRTTFYARVQYTLSSSVQVKIRTESGLALHCVSSHSSTFSR